VGWFSRKVENWASNNMRQELESFIASLRAMDGSEIGIVVAMATHLRHQLESMGHMPMDPIVYVAVNPRFPLLLSQTIGDFQKQERFRDAAALLIWAHSARAGSRLELRALGRELWRELARGFPHVEDGARSVAEMTGSRLNTQGANEFPKGLTPEPL
jgi:hypothetical protein